MAKHLSWRNLVAWSPLLFIGLFALTMTGVCRVQVWEPCIGRYAPSAANMAFGLSKSIALLLLILAIGLGVIKKLTWLGWVGIAVSAIFTVAYGGLFID